MPPEAWTPDPIDMPFSLMYSDHGSIGGEKKTPKLRSLLPDH
jgi:hypothetical protein